MLKITEFGTNEEAELHGIWKLLEGETYVLVARARNERYKIAMREALDKYGMATLLPKLTEEEQKDINCSVEAETILLGWKKLADDDGEVEYSKAVAKSWLMKYKEFRSIIRMIAENVDNFREENIQRTKESIKK